MHLFLEKPVLGLCPKCSKSVRSHTACFNCGYYKGEKAFDVLKKLTKKQRKVKEKEITAKEETQKGSDKKGGLSWEGLSKK